jgi:transposase
MPNRRIDIGLKIAACRLYERELLGIDDILDAVGFSPATFYRCWALYKATGSPVKPPSTKKGRPRLLIREDIDYILHLVRARPDWFGVELARLLEHNRFLSVHFTTIYRELKRLRISNKKLHKIAAERNETVRSDFMLRMAAYDPATIGFIDETSKDERTWSRNRGWAPKNFPASMAAPFVCDTRLSGTGLLTLDGMVAVTVCKGSMTRAMLIEWLEHDVVSMRLVLCSRFLLIRLHSSVTQWLIQGESSRSLSWTMQRFIMGSRCISALRIMVSGF